MSAAVVWKWWLGWCGDPAAAAPLNRIRHPSRFDPTCVTSEKVIQICNFGKKTALNLVPGDGGDGALQQRGAGASARPPRGGGVAQLLGGHPLPRPKRPMLHTVCRELGSTCSKLETYFDVEFRYSNSVTNCHGIVCLDLVFVACSTCRGRQIVAQVLWIGRRRQVPQSRVMVRMGLVMVVMLEAVVTLAAVMTVRNDVGGSAVSPAVTTVVAVAAGGGGGGVSGTATI